MFGSTTKMASVGPSTIRRQTSAVPTQLPCHDSQKTRYGESVTRVPEATEAPQDRRRHCPWEKGCTIARTAAKTAERTRALRSSPAQPKRLLAWGRTGEGESRGHLRVSGIGGGGRDRAGGGAGGGTLENQAAGAAIGFVDTPSGAPADEACARPGTACRVTGSRHFWLESEQWSREPPHSIPPPSTTPGPPTVTFSPPPGPRSCRRARGRRRSRCRSLRDRGRSRRWCRRCAGRRILRVRSWRRAPRLPALSSRTSFTESSVLLTNLMVVATSFLQTRLSPE